jgi:ankyrin repeat protein
MADLLLKRGADVNAIDVDHESTAAQWMVRDRQDVARHLVQREGRTDILMASAFGDAAAVTRILDADPAAIRTTVSEQYFPKQDPRAGGTIYTWTLGTSKSAHEIAREFGHEDIVQLLLERTPDEMKLSVACEVGDEALFKRLTREHPGLAGSLMAEDRRKLADAARNNNAKAVRLMLEAGWPPDARGQHNATALHWAGFHGNPDMARALLAHHAPLEVKEDDFNGTPLQWAIYGSEHGWNCRTGDYPATVETLLGAGAQPPPLEQVKVGTPAVIEVLRRHGAR